MITRALIIYITGAVYLSSCSQGETRLVREYEISGDTIPAPLTSAPGDPETGKALFISRNSGHCILCHAVEGLDATFQGNVGPDLSDAGTRLSEGQLRLRIADYQRVRPSAVMPSYYRIHDLYQVGARYKNKPALTADQIEDLIAYLKTLKVDP